MTTLRLIFILIFFVVAFWGNNKYVAEIGRTIINIVLIILVVVLILNLMGVPIGLDSKV